MDKANPFGEEKPSQGNGYFGNFNRFIKECLCYDALRVITLNVNSNDEISNNIKYC
jgi:hypothetical protein